MTSIENARTMIDYFSGVNTITNDWFMFLVVVTFFIIMVVVYMKYEEDILQVIVVSSTITTIVTGILWSIDLIADKFIIYPAIILMGSLIAFKLRN